MKQKHVNIIICIFVFAFYLNIAFAGDLFVSPTSGKIINHSPFHTGIDVFSEPGEKVYSVIVGKVLRVESDDKSSWRGLIIGGMANDVNYTVRMLGITPIIDVGSKVDLQTAIGVAQDPGIVFPGVKPYLHIEVYRDGKRIDPTNFIAARIKNRPIVHPAVEVDYNLKINDLVAKAKSLEKDSKYLEAIDVYLQALKQPAWETTTTYIMHYIADNYAQLGKFAEVVKTQREMLRMLDYELKYSSGALPDKSLGVIAAVNTEESLRILIANHSANLKAYEENKQTYIHY